MSIIKEKEMLARIKELEAEISSLKKRKKYGLVWEDKPEDVVAQCETHVPVLSEVKGKKISDKNQPSENIIIEGDNYHALSVLSYTHRNAIDVIYIDPPYNTGARDWKYNNDYVDSEDSYRHSKWISIMEKRIRISRNLLSEKGIIVCAIDHYELFTLGLLMNQVFGEENRLGIVAVVHKSEGRNQEKFFGTSHEYALFYAKDRSKAKFNSIALSDEVKSKFNRRDNKGLFKLNTYINKNHGQGGIDTSSRENRPEFWYPVFVSKDLNEITLDFKEGYFEIFPISKSGQERTWRTKPETLIDRIKSDLIVAEMIEGKPQIFEKYYENQVIKSHWIDSKYHATQYGTKLLTNILGDNKFNFPKSIHLLEDILKLTSQKTSTILDFFAGSGTTGHAVLELNKEDGGNRQFILCTNNENKIAEEVTYPRVKKVIQGYGDTDGLGGALRYYKTKLVDIEKLQKIPDERRLKLTYQAGEMIALRENTLDETEKNEWWQIFENNNKTVAIYFQEDKQKLRDLVKKINSNEQVVLYVFSWGKNEYKNEFAEYQNIRVEDIPEPIIEVYKEINRLK